MKIRVQTVLWTIIRRLETTVRIVDNCGDEDHCQYHLGIDHCTVRLETAVRIESTVRMEMSMQINDQDQWSALNASI